jgi:hypothetical protein
LHGISISDTMAGRKADFVARAAGRRPVPARRATRLAKVLAVCSVFSRR